MQDSRGISRQYVSAATARNRSCFPFACAAFIVLLLSSTIAGAQQKQLKRYDLYVGFADLNSPALGLNQTGLRIHNSE
jgi:hypothetical protein